MEKYFSMWNKKSLQIYTLHAPVGVDELIGDLGPDTACVDHCAQTTGKARNYGYLLSVFCEEKEKVKSLFA